MRQSTILTTVSCLALAWGGGLETAQAQVVRVAPIVRQTPTAPANVRFPGTIPPASDPLVDTASTFYVEIWASNVGAPLAGLACVHVDLFYDRTDLMDAVSPVQNSSLFPIQAVPPAFNDAGGTIGDIGGCQAAPAVGMLGVNEWVLVDRVQFSGVGVGGPITVSLSDANNLFAGTSIIGQLNNVLPAAIDFQFRTWVIGDCLVDADCNDANPCTDDACAGFLCVNTPDNSNDPDDGLFCNGTDTCVGGAIMIGAPPNCNDANPCTDDSCDEINNLCLHVNDNTNNPGDGQFCNGVETCLGGAIVPGTPPNCNDLNVCTNDSCDEINDVCVNANNTMPCNDNNACTTGDVCSAGVCAGVPVAGCQLCSVPADCNDGNPCTDDTCPAGTCLHTFNTVPCNDAVPCTINDTCAVGVCAGVPRDCSSLTNACNLGTCNAASGNCEALPANEGGTCNDANLCTLMDRCMAGACFGVAVNCSALSNSCNVGTCNLGTGMCQAVPANQGGMCNDANSCTTADACSNGACLGTPLSGCTPCMTVADCNDANPCTNEMCHPAGVCVYTNNSNPCNDGNLCTSTDTCSGGTCSGSPVNCSAQSNDCNVGVCNPADGLCQANPINQGGACNDANPCTLITICNNGVCGGPDMDCSAVNNDCNVGVCNPATGLCEPSPANPGGPCDDMSVCTMSDTCAGGVCVGTPISGCTECTTAAQCDDGNPCTDQSCHTAGFCVYSNNTVMCDDANPCTQTDTCMAGTCAGTPVAGCQNCMNASQCDDANACTTNLCNAGVCSFVNSTPAGQCCSPTTGIITPIDDLDACTADVCNPNGSVTHTVTTPAGQCCNPTTGLLTAITDNNACTLDTCNANGSVTHTSTTPAGQCCNPLNGTLTALDDGSFCTTDTCQANGMVTHVGNTPAGQCCNPNNGILTPIDDANACTLDACNATGLVTHTVTTPLGQCCNPVDGVLSPISDNNVCTTDGCNPNGSVTHNATTPAGQCCNPISGALTPITDGNVCTVDICNANGTVTHNDPTPAGLCCDPISGVLRSINDNNACTTDVCNPDGTVGHTIIVGPCDDDDDCTVNDTCVSGVCSGAVADPFCTPALNLIANLPPAPAGGQACVQTGDLITVQIEMGPSTPVIIGGQFFLEYDPQTLDFLGMVSGAPPFTFEIFEFVDELRGSIDYAVGVPLGTGGSTTPTIMATITFRAVGDCASFVRFRAHTPPTRLTDVDGIARTPLLGLPVALNINGSSAIFNNCPGDAIVNADAGRFSAVVTWPNIIAQDVCDDPVQVGCNIASGAQFPIGTTVVRCDAVSACGIVDTCTFNVTVRPFSELLVSVQLSPSIVAGPITRCITFEITQCGFVAHTVEQDIEFFNGLALEVPVLVPAGFYECITARDRLHTLRTTSNDFRDDGTTFVATFVGATQFGGHGLTGGNLNGDDYIDIVDFAIHHARVGVSFPNTPCTLGGPHADINGDGLVNAFDFSFIQQNFLRSSQPNCCGLPVAVDAGPQAAISIEQLQAQGLGHLAGADLNGDGMIDLADIEAFVNQTNPADGGADTLSPQPIRRTK